MPSINPELNSDLMVAEYNRFVALTGWMNWRNKINELARLNARNYIWKRYITRKHHIPLALNSVRQHIERTGRCAAPPRNVQEYRCYAFIGMFMKVYDVLSDNARRSLLGKINEGLTNEAGLRPFEFELRTVTNLAKSGFSIVFNDLENQGGFDFLATKNGKQIEVECKHVSGDIGRKVHLKRMCELSTDLDQTMSQIIDALPEGKVCHIHLKLPDRLTGATTQHQSIKTNVLKAFETMAEAADAQCKASPAMFDFDANVFQEGVEQDTAEAVLREHLQSRGVSSNAHTLAKWRNNKAAIVITIQSEKDDQVIESILEHLADSARNQFSKDRPGVLCMHLADVSEEQLMELYNAEQSGQRTGLGLAMNNLMRRRPHLHAIAITVDGVVNVRRSSNAYERRTSVMEENKIYVYTNTDQPTFDESIFADTFLDA